MSNDDDNPQSNEQRPGDGKPSDSAPFGKTDEQLEAEEQERRQFIDDTDDTGGVNLFGEPTINGHALEEREARISALLSDHDPDAKHATYYQGLQKLLKDYLPRDPKVRRMIYDEKNILINKGAPIGPDGRRGSDGRMASIDLMEDAIQIVADWLRAGGTALQLYMAFYNANEQRGYPHQVDVDAGS